MEYSGLFVVLEGIDGSGKTTISKMLVDRLNRLGFKAEYTFEPTDSEIVEVIRGKYSEYRDAYIDALTFALDRLLHLKRKVIPLLRDGFIVVSDRYMYSSVAYQAASGAPIEWVLLVNKYALKPDVTIYLDVDPETGLRRRQFKTTRFPEFEVIDFARRVREVYLELVKRGLMISINATRPVEEVYRDVEAVVLNAVRSKEPTP
ncbi:MAG: dTMP kinase [Thermosphaera sp.]|nr:dTMP kinase [Thermosphaera sp.]